MIPPPPRSTLFPYTTLFRSVRAGRLRAEGLHIEDGAAGRLWLERGDRRDRKSTRLNSSHLGISYAVFCLKKKKTEGKRKYLQKKNSKALAMEDSYEYEEQKN